MSDQRKGGIAWTDETWNPLRGCSRVSEGCCNCYAEAVAARFSGPGQPYEGLAERTERGPRWTGEVRLIREKLDQPLRWRRPRRVFVNSMSDLFHESVPFETIAAIYGVMAAAPQHTFQVLTKRPARAREFFEWLDAKASACQLVFPYDSQAWRRLHCLNAKALIATGHRRCVIQNPVWPPPNVWLGVSVEDQATADERIPLLLKCPAAVRWVSAEPLLGPVDFVMATGNTSFDGGGDFGPDRTFDWVVVGGESGPRARPCDVTWVRSIIVQCRVAGVPVFVKQLGSKARSARPRDHTDRLRSKVCAETGLTGLVLRNRKGGDPSEWPEDLRVREWPDGVSR